VRQTWQHVVDLCPKIVTACEEASVSVLQGRHLRTDAATGELARRADAIQDETGQGPSLDVIRVQERQRTGDLGRDERWPTLSARVVAETGLRSMLSFRLFVDSTTLGALNLYSSKVDAFDDADTTAGAEFAAHAALLGFATLMQQEVQQLRVALDSNRRIGAAIGILVIAHNCTEDEAFHVLRRASQRLNIKLRDVAERVIEARGQPLRW